MLAVSIVVLRNILLDRIGRPSAFRRPLRLLPNSIKRKLGTRGLDEGARHATSRFETAVDTESLRIFPRRPSIIRTGVITQAKTKAFVALDEHSDGQLRRSNRNFELSFG